MLRYLRTALIAVLVLYAPIELTRVIVLYAVDFEHIAEIACIWLLYIIGIWLVFRLVKGR